jgi:hypothetical protein
LFVDSTEKSDVPQKTCASVILASPLGDTLNRSSEQLLLWTKKQGFINLQYN